MFHRTAIVAMAGCLVACSEDGSQEPVQNSPPVTSTPVAPPVLALPIPSLLPGPRREPQIPLGTLSCPPCKRIVFVSSRDGNAELYTVLPDGTELTRLTQTPDHEGEPSWSPDGQRIAYWRRIAGGKERDLYLMDATGANQERVTVSNGYVASPTWSPDGRIAFSYRSNGSDDIWMASPGSTDGPTPLFSSPSWEGFPAWSPDGIRIIFASDRLDPEYDPILHLIGPDGTGLIHLVDRPSDPISHLAFSQMAPCWSPDGTRLAVSTYYWRMSEFRYDSEIGTMNTDGSGYTALVAGGGSKCTWSPDGTTIVYATGASVSPYSNDLFSTSEIRWVKADGSSRGTIVRDGIHPDWQR